jgi:hypothetical protein
MPEEPPAKTRIDAKAQDALNDIDQLVTTYREQQDIQLGLQEIRQLLVDIQGDTHSP